MNIFRKLFCLLPLFFLYPVSGSGQVSFEIKKTFNESGHQIINATYSLAGKYIVTAGIDNNIIIWNAETGIIYKTLAGNKSNTEVVVFDEENNILASAGLSDSITLWHPSTSSIFARLAGHKGSIKSLSLSADGKYLASGGTDQKVIIWDLKTRSRLYELKGHSGDVNSTCFSPDGLLLATVGSDKKLILWEVASGKILKSSEIHSAPVRDVKFSPDGKMIATCGDDGLIKISGIPDLDLKYSLKGHTGRVNTICFNNEGNYLISGGNDHFFILWDVATGKIVTQSENQEYVVSSISFNPAKSDFLTACLNSENFSTWSIEGTMSLLFDYLKSDQSGVMADLIQKDKKEEAVSKAFEEVKGPPNVMGEFASKAPPNQKKEITKSYEFKEDRIEGNLEKPPIIKKTDSASKTRDNKQGKKIIRLDEIAVMGKPEKTNTESEKAFYTDDYIAKPNAVYIDPNVPNIDLYYPLEASGETTTDLTSSFVIGRITHAEGTNVILVNKKPVKLSDAGVFELKIDLTKGINPVDITVVNKKGKMSQVTLKIECLAETDSINSQESSSAGKYYALLIGINDYKSADIPSLDNPVKDAESLYNVLSTKYTFDKENITFLKNPTLNEIISTLDGLVGKLTTNDNLLIFYAGHGYWDEKGKVGYWFPSDATKNSTVNWFRNSTLRDFIGSIQAKHTLLIADACFSGAIFKTRAAFNDAPQGVQKLYDLPSRKAMTSGLFQVVPDESTFMKYLVERLAGNNEKFLPSETLFSSFKTAVMNNSQNVPQYGVIQNVGDEGGDFIFVKR